MLAPGTLPSLQSRDEVLAHLKQLDDVEFFLTSEGSEMLRLVDISVDKSRDLARERP